MAAGVCPNCRAPTVPGHAFCGSCGAPLTAAPAPLPTPTVGVPAGPIAGGAPPPSAAPQQPMVTAGVAPVAPVPPVAPPGPQGPAPPAAVAPPAGAYGAPPQGYAAAPVPGYAPAAAPGYAPQPGAYASAPPGYVPAPGPTTNAMMYGKPAFVPRLLAFFIDGLIVGVVGGLIYPVWWFLGPLGGLIGWWFPAILMAVYMMVMESNSGQTLGKMLMDVKVVKEDLTAITMKEAQTRAMFILLYPLLIPVLLDLMSASEQGQTLGDKQAHTIVMQVK